jgi:hypothetical protein
MIKIKFVTTSANIFDNTSVIIFTGARIAQSV